MLVKIELRPEDFYCNDVMGGTTHYISHRALDLSQVPAQVLESLVERVDGVESARVENNGSVEGKVSIAIVILQRVMARTTCRRFVTELLKELDTLVTTGTANLIVADARV
ncbi:MAG TPA: hypothetical protein VK694_05520 [Verrucomicrobiae bacterium]|nr:hypothetical protein [Verrucomicrobiae bacterium]